MSIFDSMFGVNKQKHANDEKNKKGKQHESVMPNITDATDESTPPLIAINAFFAIAILLYF